MLKVDQDRYYVHYMGYNASHDKWVKATEVKKYLFVSMQHTVSLFKNKMVSWACKLKTCMYQKTNKCSLTSSFKRNILETVTFLLYLHVPKLWIFIFYHY